MTAAHFVDASIALIFGAFAAIIVLIALLMADDRRHIRHGRLPLQPLEPDGEICLCCTSRPFTVDDCNCREDCGQVHCQARDFEVLP